MGDQQTTVAELKELLAAFVAERDWEQFHAPKNLAMSIAIEAAELMEHFQWIGVKDSRELTAEARAEVAEELADVACYTLALANSLNLDLSDSIRAKMQKNAVKYPEEAFRGRFGAKDRRIRST